MKTFISCDGLFVRPQSGLSQVLRMLVCLVTVLMGAERGFGGEPAPGLPGETLAAVKSIVLSRLQGIESIEVAYRAAGDDSVHGSRHVVRQLDHFRNVENIHFGRLPEDLDTNRTIQLFDKRTFDVYNVHARYLETSTRNALMPYMWKARVDFYVTAVGWWPADDDEPPDNLQHNMFRPLRFLLADEGCTLGWGVGPRHQGLVVIDRPGRDRVWLDPQLNYAVRRREVLDRDAGKVVVTAELSEFREYENKSGQIYFLPTRIIVAYPEHDGVQNSKQTIVTVESLKLDSLTRDDFVFHPPPGTLIQNRDTGKYFLLPGGREVLDQNIQMAADFRRLVLEARQEGP